MGKQSRRKQERRHSSEWQAIKQARRTWLGQVVEFDIQRGDGVRRGKVTSISEDGDMVVECLPEYVQDVSGVALSLGLADSMLKLVQK